MKLISCKAKSKTFKRSLSFSKNASTQIKIRLKVRAKSPSKKTWLLLGHNPSQKSKRNSQNLPDTQNEINHLKLSFKNQSLKFRVGIKYLELID